MVWFSWNYINQKSLSQVHCQRSRLINIFLDDLIDGIFPPVSWNIFRTRDCRFFTSSIGPYKTSTRGHLIKRDRLPEVKFSMTMTVYSNVIVVMGLRKARKTFEIKKKNHAANTKNLVKLIQIDCRSRTEGSPAREIIFISNIWKIYPIVFCVCKIHYYFWNDLFSFNISFVF